MRNLLLLLGFLVSFQIANGQSTVTGTVTDSNNEPLLAATVLEQGTSNATLSDVNGNFSLTMEDDSNPIIVSYTGYTRKTIPLNGQTSIDVSLDADGQVIQEVVINALGLEEQRDELGSTYSVIEAAEVADAGEATLLNSLGSKASSVRINRSNGDPGAGSTIRIRGANTIDGDGDPLFVVDGVPMNNSSDYAGGNGITGGRTGGVSQQSRINDINPNDIASVQVLKGASAAALWGSRAANGVVVITTKNGQAGRAKINYKTNLSLDQVSERIPMQTVWGQGRNGSFSPTSSESWGDYIPDRSGGADVENTGGAYFAAESGVNYYPITGKNDQSTFVESNWDQVIGNGSLVQHDLSVSGGNEKSTYYFSMDRLDNNGIISNSNYDRTNFRFNNKMYLNDILTLSAKAAYTLTGSNRIQQNSNTTGLMLGLLRTPPDFDDTDYKGTYVSSSGQEFANRHRSYRRYLGNSSNPTYNNARWTVEEQTALTDVNRIVVTPQLDIKPEPWLLFVLRGNADVSSDRRSYFFPISSAGTRSGGRYAEDGINRREINFDAISKADFVLTPTLDLNATLGWSINDRKYRRNSGEISGFQVAVNKETTSLNTAADASIFDNFRSFRRSNRGYGVLGFDFNEQLFLNLSGGLEASSTVNGSFFYPAADLAWDVGKATTLPDAFSFLKMRASFGKVGVQPRAHAFQTTAETGFSYSSYSDPLELGLFGGGFRINDDLGNPDLSPEIKTEWEIGADMRFLDDRLAYTVTYYNNNIEDILLNVELSPSSGFDTQYGNFGAMENNGLEMDLTFGAVQNDDFGLDVYANWSKNNNLVTDLEGTETIDLTGLSVSSRAIVGHPLGVLYGTGSQTDAAGNFILDGNGFPQPTAGPTILGDPNPDWRGGLGFNANYKKLKLDVLLEHSQGGDFSPRSLWVLRRFGTTQETANRFTTTQALTNFDGNVIPAGTTVRGNVTDFGAGPVLLDETWYRHGIGGGFGDNQLYNFNIEDATFTKLREVALSYRLDSDGFRDIIPIQGLTIGANARNWFNWNKIDGIDPETNLVGVSSGYGIEYFTNPQTRSLLFTLSADF